MYLTSCIHREQLFNIAERWFCGKMEPGDALRLTEILICDGFVIRDTLENLAARLLGFICRAPFRTHRIRLKGELRDALCRHPHETSPRLEELFREYRANPDFYYRESPINGVMCLDERNRLVGLFRIKRPTRIAEKANRYIANWIFRIVREKAQEKAEERARRSGVPLRSLLTPEKQMADEFIEAEKAIAGGFSAGAIAFDKAALTINDVGGLKIISDSENLSRLEAEIAADPTIGLVQKELHTGNYNATSLLLHVPWDRERVCRRYLEEKNWEKYTNRGVPEEKLRRGLEPVLEGSDPTLCVELILSTFPDMVESELGSSIHEERILAQRDDRTYKGYIPMNVEFLVDYLLAVGLSPQVEVDHLPIKTVGKIPSGYFALLYQAVVSSSRLRSDLLGHPPAPLIRIAGEVRFRMLRTEDRVKAPQWHQNNITHDFPE